MTKDNIITLRKLIEKNGAKEYNILDARTSGDKIYNFHDWADGRKYEGAFLISNKYNESYWFVLIEWKPQIYYLVLFPEKRNGPLVEIHKLHNDDHNNQYLTWRYKPTKRDGKNSERIDYFRKFYFDSAVTISFPVGINEMSDFYHELFLLIETRLKSDVLDDIEPEFRDSFPEGKRIERLHKARERNPQLVKIAKAQFKKKHGKLFCEVCKFNFEDKYGRIGADFIEAHHTQPLSQILADTVQTQIADIAMLCCNCHKMIHRKRPWLTMDKIANLLNEQK